LILSEKYIENYKATLKIAIPVVISQLGHIMVGVVDTAMVGQIGPEEQAAIALSNSLYYLVLVFGLGISMGLTPLVAAADSSGNKEECGALLKNGIIINTAIGIILFLLLFFISPTLHFFDQKESVVNKAIPFLNVMLLGMIPLMFFSAFKQFAEGLSNTTAAMIITLGANVINILLNYLLIFGHWGFPEMGMIGSAWASFIARFLMAISILIYLYYTKSFKEYWNHYKESSISKTLINKILKIGIPSGLQWVFEVAAFAFAVVMIGWISPKHQAAHQIALSMAAISYMMASGLSAATAVRVGNQKGLNNREGMRAAGFSAFIMVLLFMTCCAIIFIVFKNSLPSLFSNEADVINIASGLLIIAAAFQLSDGIQVVALGVLRGVNDLKIPTAITLIAYWIIGLPMSYVFGFTLNLGLAGIWYGLLLGLTVAAVLLFWRFNYVSKKL